MKKLCLILLLALAIISCSVTKNSSVNSSQTSIIKNQERDGSSFNKAIFIDKKSEMDGVKAEYEWIYKNYPGCKVNGQALLIDNNKPYDKIEITTSENEKKSIYFDISSFYGKM